MVYSIKIDEKEIKSYYYFIIFNFVIKNLDKVDKIIKATFGLSETEMECINLMDLVNVGVEIYKWVVDKINSLKGENEKNLTATA